MLLKNGQYTRSPLLDAVPYKDPRSRNFPAVTVEERATITPQTVWWRLDRPVLDQGNLGRCVGCGLTHMLHSRPRSFRPPGNDLTWATEQVYWPAQKIDSWQGGAYPPLTPSHPDWYEGTSLLAGLKVLQAAKRIGAYTWNFSADEGRLAIQKAPLVGAFPWFTGMMDVDANGYVWPTGIVEGWHCVAIIAYSLSYDAFLIPQSWGPWWSDNVRWMGSNLDGYAKIKRTALQQLMAQGGELAVCP